MSYEGPDPNWLMLSLVIVFLSLLGLFELARLIIRST